MSKKEEFKEFVRKHPELIQSVKTGSKSWQDFYEMYDLYGSGEDVWREYLDRKEIKNDANIGAGLGELTNLVKNINMDNIQKHINTAQKAISVIQELTSKTPPAAAATVAKTPRPLTKFFND